ncbi:MAG: nuclear transport factor 2 family protein [Lautropia sp.]
MPEDSKIILEKANAAMAAGDTEGFLAHCTEDTEWNFVGDRTLRGKAAVRAYLAEAYGKPPKFDASDLIAEGEFVTALGEITITGKDGREASYWYCDVWSLRGGKLDKLRAFVVEQ